MLRLTSSSEDQEEAVEEIVVCIQGVLNEFKLPPITKQTRLYVNFDKFKISTNDIQGG
jgi:uncharacterized protein (DUF2235 family)